MAKAGLGRQADNAHIPDPMVATRTSVNSPLRIDAVVAGGSAGLIGMTLCPGKQGESQFGSSWQRDLTLDIDQISQWGAKALVTAMELEEMRKFGVAELGQAATAAGLTWVHLPIADGQIPDARFELSWPTTAPALMKLLTLGQKVVVHCRGGLGRTGMIASLLLIESGKAPRDALQMVRRARPGAVETTEQEVYVLNYRRRF